MNKKTVTIIASLFLCFFITGCSGDLVSYINDEGLSTVTHIYKPAVDFNDIEFNQSTHRSIKEYPAKVIYFDSFEGNDAAIGNEKKVWEYHAANAHLSSITLVSTTSDENYDIVCVSAKQGFLREDDRADLARINMYIHLPSGNFSYTINNEQGVAISATGYGNVQSYMSESDIIVKRYTGFKTCSEELYNNEFDVFHKYFSYFLNTLQNYLTPLGFDLVDLGFSAYTPNTHDILIPATIYHKTNYSADIIGISRDELVRELLILNQ